MPIEKSAHFVNTERLRLKKMTPKLWKELASLEELVTLYFCSIEGIDDYLGRLTDLTRLEEIGFISVIVGEKISEISIPDSCKTLYVKNFESEYLRDFPELGGITTAKFRQDDKDVATILPKLPRLQNLEIGETYDESSLVDLLQVLNGLTHLQKLKISRDSLQEATIRGYFDFARARTVEIEWETDEESQQLIDKLK
jgi:hypothetical protein